MLDQTWEHGWTAVPHSLTKIIADRPTKTTSKPVSVEEIHIPDTPLVKTIQAYAKESLTKQTYNHCMRVYCYGASQVHLRAVIYTNGAATGQAITTQHFPHWHCSSETLLLTALLHDIGTTTKNQTGTRLSFEFAGGFIALELLKSHSASISQAEAVCETIIRHQDLDDAGKMSTLSAIIQFATVLDNAGLNAELVATGTIESVVAAFPRDGWTGCFAAVVRKECELKPWANTSRIEGFAGMVEANDLMAPYDQ
jgi:cyanamide hydratase